MLEEEVRCEGERVWEMNRCGQIERDRGNENRIAKSIYIDPQYFSTDRDVEPSIEEGVKKNNVDRCSCRGKSKDTKTDAQSLHQLSRSYRGSRNFLDQSTNYRGSVEITIRKSLRARQIARCRGGVEIA